MDASAYEAAISRPNAFSRNDLIATMDALRTETTRWTVQQVLQSPPILKPLFRKDCSDTDFFAIEMSIFEVEEILKELLDAEAAGSSRGKRATAVATRVSALVDKWSRYLESLW